MERREIDVWPILRYRLSVSFGARHDKTIGGNISFLSGKNIDIIAAVIDTKHLHKSGSSFYNITAFGSNSNFSRKDTCSGNFIVNETIYAHVAIKLKQNVSRVAIERVHYHSCVIFYIKRASRFYDNPGSIFLVTRAYLLRLYGCSGFYYQSFSFQIKHSFPCIRRWP